MLELPVFQSLFQILPSQKHPQQAYLQRVVQGLAVLAFMALSTQVKAQSSDAAGVKVLGQVTTVSCQLVMTTDPNPSFSSTHNPSLALNLGSTTLTAANAANVGSTFGEAKTIFLFSRGGVGSNCPGGPTFDIGLTINQDKVVNVGTNSFLRSNDSVPGGAAQGVALSLLSNHRDISAPTANRVPGETFLNLRNTASGIGPLLSGKTNLVGPYATEVEFIGNRRLFALTAQFVKTSATVTPGSYLTNITVNLWWR
jgi:hypothetical protein